MLNTYVKTGDPAALKREAQILRHVAHPNVVEVLRCRDRELSFVQLDAEPVIDSNLDEAQLLDICRSLFRTLAHLHKRGVAHRNICATTVVVDPMRHMTLRGFDRAVPVPADEEHLFDDDVVAAGRLIASLLPDPLVQLRRGNTFAEETSLLRRVSSKAISGGASASEIVSMMRTPTRRRSLPLRRMLVASTATCVCVVLLVVVPRIGVVSRDDGAAASEVGIPGGIIVHASKPYELGTHDDRVFLGRWNCSDELPLLLRSADSTLWAYDNWPDDGGFDTGRLVASDVGPVEITTGQCDSVVVNGNSVVVPS